MHTKTERVRSPRKVEISGFVARAGTFILHFLELQIPMGLGALVCYLLGRLIPAASSFATIYHPGTYLYATGDVLFLTTPVVVWKVLRGHGWQHSLEMAAAMLAPVVAIVILRILGVDNYLPWLAKASCPSMYPAMLAAMLYRRDHYTGQAGHSTHTVAPEAELSCHAD